MDSFISPSISPTKSTATHEMHPLKWISEYALNFLACKNQPNIDQLDHSQSPS